MGKISGLLENKRAKLMLFILVDIIMLFIISIMSLLFRFDFSGIPKEYITNIKYFFAIDASIMLFVFYNSRLYKNVWTYASIYEALYVVTGCTITVLIEFMYKFILNIHMPRSFYVMQLIMLIFSTGATRFSKRIIHTLKVRYENRFRSTNTMIIGGGEAGRLLIEELTNNKKYNNRVLCVIDDNPNKKGKYLKSIPIVGSRKDIAEAAEKYNIDEIIIAIPSANKDRISSIVDECQKTKAEIKILPTVMKLSTKDELKGNVMGKVRPLSYEDFIGRNEIVVNSEEIKNNLTDKVVMVTGGGGSIGTELTRQIAKCNPKQLIIFDIYENNAYEIQQELFRNYPNLDLRTIIGSVRDYDRLERVFKDFNLEVIFHAAAHKHVPLMEVSPNEAIKNNCLGTLNVAKLADIYKVKKFVLVSTDKAVRPTNVMGATKRICEMIVQTYNKKSKNTHYVAVRFGNVLGSNGSVIPLFMKQIDNGGPVTVTHKDITRYFMTIPEAVNLILQAYVYAEGGEIFVLDMGKPVRIYDLAERIIRFRGLEPGVDIDIKITGLRPGEKLYEERLMDEEGMKKTPNELISIGQPLEIDKDFEEKLDTLIKYAYQNRDDIKDKVTEIVKNYAVDKERIGK